MFLTGLISVCCGLALGSLNIHLFIYYLQELHYKVVSGCLATLFYFIPDGCSLRV